jgi:hypothetical protein
MNLGLSSVKLIGLGYSIIFLLILTALHQCFNSHSVVRGLLSFMHPGGRHAGVVGKVEVGAGDWDEHFERNGVLIVGRSAVGRVAVGLLKMNAADRRRLRAGLAFNEERTSKIPIGTISCAVFGIKTNV